MNPVRIEGSGLEVQADEKFIYRRKYGVGRLNRQFLLLRGVCPAQPGVYF